MADRLLIIEDETLLGQELARHFRSQDMEVVLATSLAEARNELNGRGQSPLAVLADMSLPDGNSLDLLAERRESHPNIEEWVLLTGYGSVPDSLRAVRLGAYDFLEKPCDQTRLDVVLHGALRSARAQRRLQDQSARIARCYPPEAFIGASAAASELRELLGRIAEVGFSALIITGETGTGKGLTARILHYSGPRANSPFITVNCAALPRELLESEIFGHEAGAFTGAKGRHRGYLEQADGGTLFLDEIGEMAPDLQAKLLTTIEDQTVRRLGGERTFKVDVQVIAATNQDIDNAVREGRFRVDLFHRLSVFRVPLPTLRERPEDLQELAEVLIAELNQKAERRVRRIPPGVIDQLRGYAWPGNVRELRNVLERCVLLSKGETLAEQWLQLGGPGATSGQPKLEGDQLTIPLNGSMCLEEMDRYIIQCALERNQNNVTAAARALGTTRETLRYRIHKHQINTDPAAAEPK